MSSELNNIIGKINKKFLKGSPHSKPIIVRGEDVKEHLKPKFQPTGIHELDTALGGGIPHGAITTLFGDPGGGKSSAALMLVKEVQARGGTAVWVNAEPPFPYLVATMIGVDLDNLILIDCRDYGEQILDVIRELLFDSDNRITRQIVDLVVVDSLNGLIPKAQVNSTEEKGSEGHTMGRRAAMLSKWLEELSGRGMLREGCILLNVAQMRVDINAYGAPKKMSGGLAVEFFSKVAIKMLKKRTDGVDREKGHTVECEVTKNNILGRLGNFSYDVLYGSGVNDSEKVIAQAMELGIVKKIKGKLHEITVQEETITVEDGIAAVRSLIKSDLNVKNKIKEQIEHLQKAQPEEQKDLLDIAEIPISEDLLKEEVNTSNVGEK
jgi:recombination protein RecA